MRGCAVSRRRDGLLSGTLDPAVLRPLTASMLRADRAGDAGGPDPTFGCSTATDELPLETISGTCDSRAPNQFCPLRRGQWTGRQPRLSIGVEGNKLLIAFTLISADSSTPDLHAAASLSPG